MALASDRIGRLFRYEGSSNDRVLFVPLRTFEADGRRLCLCVWVADGSFGRIARGSSTFSFGVGCVVDCWAEEIG